jgi:hypothetical protein
MKRILTTLLMLVSIAGTATFATMDDDDPVIIIINNGESLGGPRTPTQPPIQGVVYGGTIYLGFASDFGTVDVVIDEDMSGLILHTVVDSSNLSAAIPFSEDEGDFRITFTLSSGTVYYGEFELTSTI